MRVPACLYYVHLQLSSKVITDQLHMQYKEVGVLNFSFFASNRTFIREYVFMCTYSGRGKFMPLPLKSKILEPLDF